MMKPGQEVTLANGMSFRIFNIEIVGPHIGNFSARPVDDKSYIRCIFFNKDGIPDAYMGKDPNVLEGLKIDHFRGVED